MGKTKEMGWNRQRKRKDNQQQNGEFRPAKPHPRAALEPLARALLAPFDALALAEPFTGLDRENRDLALACIRETAGDRPVLLVTHDAADAAGSPVVSL